MVFTMIYRNIHNIYGAGICGYSNYYMYLEFQKARMNDIRRTGSSQIFR